MALYILSRCPMFSTKAVDYVSAGGTVLMTALREVTIIENAVSGSSDRSWRRLQCAVRDPVMSPEGGDTRLQ